MPKYQELPEEINGFKIIKDLGKYREGNKNRYALVICKGCNKEFETSMTSIYRIKSCGCKPIRLAKALENEINGFKIIKDLGYSNGSRRAVVICKVCQKEYEVDPNKLRYRKNCGCIKNGTRVSPYAASHPRLIQSYKYMRSRCYNKNNQDYYNYGARGIKVCEEWINDKNEFCEWALKNGYSDNLTIDRIDGSKGYSPENCRWSSPIDQARNTRRNVIDMERANQMRKDSSTMSLRQLALKYKVSDATAHNIINYKSWVD